MRKRKRKTISACFIVEKRYSNRISLVFSDGSVIKEFASYYPDEVTYREREFVGLTEAKARDMMDERYMEFIRSLSKKKGVSY